MTQEYKQISKLEYEDSIGRIAGIVVPLSQYESEIRKKYQPRNQSLPLIKKVDDDYFFLAYLYTINTNDAKAMSMYYFFKCDQIHGVLKCLKYITNIETRHQSQELLKTS